MGRSKPRHEAHVRLYRHEHQSPAYQSLSPEGRALLVEFRALYDGGENRIHLSRREMERRLAVGRSRAEKARDELLDRGFIRLLTKGMFTRKALHASEYALTNEPMGNNLAPKDFMKWRPQKTTGLMSNHGGAGEQPREGNKQGTPVVGDQPTDKLPTGGSTDWLSEHGGWPCSRKFMQGAILDTCCIVCGVWTTSGRIEFDGAKHSCDAVSRAKYQKRLQASKDKLAEAA